MTPVAAELRRVLDDRGLTGYRLSGKLEGFNPSTITRWLNGSRAPDLYHLAVIAEAISLTNTEIARIVRAAATEDVG